MGNSKLSHCVIVSHHLNISYYYCKTVWKAKEMQRNEINQTVKCFKISHNIR